MTAGFFLGYLFVVAVLILAVTARYLPGNTIRWQAGLLLWLFYVGLLSYRGIVRNTTLRPPGIVYVLVPVFALVFYIARSSSGLRVALAVPLWLILGLQSFRIGVELLLHQLWIAGLVPRLMTYAGGNVDIFIGLSAPLIAWASTKGRASQRLALGWNILGLLALANIAARAVLTAPGPLRLIASEIPDRAIGTFPFTYIAGFFAPLAVVLHVLAMRALFHNPRNPDPSTLPSSDVMITKQP